MLSSRCNTFITEDPAIKAVLKTAEAVASSDVNVLLTGESGTGKNAIAEVIHSLSNRSQKPFVPVNCLAIPDTLIESELFGHEKGAFTDAHILRKGSFEHADGGTIYLDEIGDMTSPAQGKILQAIEEKRFRRVGGERLIHCDTRILSATNRDLAKKIDLGLFREDLFYRLNEVSLRLPPLRERRRDIPLLILYFIGYYAKTYGKPRPKISKAALEYLTQYSWPGNIRELRNAVKAAICIAPPDAVLWLEHFPYEMRLKEGVRDDAPRELDYSIESMLRKHIHETLAAYVWNKKKTAQALKISRPRLDRYIRKWKLERSTPQ